MCALLSSRGCAWLSADTLLTVMEHLEIAKQQLMAHTSGVAPER